MWSQLGLPCGRRFWRTESGGILALNPSLINPISNEELAETEFMYKLAKYVSTKHVYLNNTRILKKKKKKATVTCINTFPALCHTGEREDEGVALNRET